MALNTSPTVSATSEPAPMPTQAPGVSGYPAVTPTLVPPTSSLPPTAYPPTEVRPTNPPPTPYP